MTNQPPSRTRRPAARIPGFVSGDDEIGLGDVVKRATAAVGIRPCGSCAARAERLNRLVVFAPRNRRRYRHPS
jgi:hypothetical protein